MWVHPCRLLESSSPLCFKPDVSNSPSQRSAGSKVETSPAGNRSHCTVCLPLSPNIEWPTYLGFCFFPCLCTCQEDLLQQQEQRAQEESLTWRPELYWRKIHFFCACLIRGFNNFSPVIFDPYLCEIIVSPVDLKDALLPSENDSKITPKHSGPSRRKAVSAEKWLVII